MATELFAYMAGIKMTHIPHKGGPQALNDVIAGQVAVYFAGMPTGLPQAKAGKVRAIAVTTAKRSAAAPDIPTIQEAGVPGYEYSLWNGLFVPAATPPAVVNKIAADVSRVLQMSDVHERLTSFGIDVLGTSPAEFKEFFFAELGKWAKVVKASGIQVD
jgi:tripartite-type tricarboxylate transporter receptor subunit TctC